MSKEDKSLFMSAMQDVKPLNENKQARLATNNTPKRDGNQLIKKLKKRNFQAKHPSNTEHDFNFNENHDLVEAFEKLQYVQAGVRTQEMNALKKGNFKLNASLDLHGFTRDQAEIKIVQFLKECQQFKCRYIRIIHGKGYNSGERYPVLKNVTYQTLKSHQQVIAFHSAAEKDGGVGAINILLKAPPSFTE